MTQGMEYSETPPPKQKKPLVLKAYELLGGKEVKKSKNKALPKQLEPEILPQEHHPYPSNKEPAAIKTRAVDPCKHNCSS